MIDWRGQYVRLAKVGTATRARHPTPGWGEYQQGQEDNVYTGIPFGYWIEGFLLTKIEPGMLILVDRRIKNGEPMLGAFNTSVVIGVEEVGNDSLRIETVNSVYILSKKPTQEHSMSGESETDGTPETN